MREEAFRAARRLAVDHGISPSKLMEQLVESPIDKAIEAEPREKGERSREATEQALPLIERGPNLGAR